MWKGNLAKVASSHNRGSSYIKQHTAVRTIGTAILGVNVPLREHHPNFNGHALDVLLLVHSAVIGAETFQDETRYHPRYHWWNKPLQRALFQSPSDAAAHGPEPGLL